jgi:NAD(P)-dependent dehydrogenase (short-subunit alcohol dehydrogenase family)
VAETSLEEWRRILSVNLDGVFLGTKHAIRACGWRFGLLAIGAQAAGYWLAK